MLRLAPLQCAPAEVLQRGRTPDRRKLEFSVGGPKAAAKTARCRWQDGAGREARLPDRDEAGNAGVNPRIAGTERLLERRSRNNCVCAALFAGTK